MKNKKGRIKSQAKARTKSSEDIINTSKLKFNQNKGITLIALVVTIIVLIILALITINMIFGNSGLFETARSTREYQANATTDEEGRLGELENAIKQQGGASGGSSGSGESVDRTGLKIGDYVDYKPDTAVDYKYNLSTTYSGYTSNQEVEQDKTLKWRILNIHEDGVVDLVSAAPTSTTVYFKGAVGYNNGVYALDELCNKLYSNTAKGIQARSIDQEDFEAHLTPAGVTAKNNYISGKVAGLSAGTNIESVDTTNNTVTYKKEYSKYPNIYAKENESGIDSTITKTDGINESNPNEIDTNTERNTGETGAYKQASTKLTTKYTYYEIPINSTNYGDAATVLSNSNYYWLASRYVYCGSSIATFGLRRANTYIYGYGLFYSDNDTNGSGNRVCPVVSLGSNIQIQECTGENSSTNMHTIK